MRDNDRLAEQTQTPLVTETYVEMVPQPPKRQWWGGYKDQPDLAVTKTRQVPALQEGQFLAKGWQDYPKVAAAVERGKDIFERDCASCHSDGLGANTNEKKVRLFITNTTPCMNQCAQSQAVPKSDYITKLDKGYKRNLFIERHKYFSEVEWDNDHYYWDYQKMRQQYGPDEMGTPEPIGMPAAPHPWCAGSKAETADLVQFVMTL